MLLHYFRCRSICRGYSFRTAKKLEGKRPPGRKAGSGAARNLIRVRGIHPNKIGKADFGGGIGQSMLALEVSPQTSSPSPSSVTEGGV
jgi:hypothetical protein